jgi:hypothetical protein
MNKYNADNSAIIDASGKEWAVDIIHQCPLPYGIAPSYDEHSLSLVVVAPGHCGGWTPHSYDKDKITHWLARRPLPPVPKPKTQTEKTEEAAKKWAHGIGCKSHPDAKWTVGDVWDAFKAGADYARKEAK